MSKTASYGTHLTEPSGRGAIAPVQAESKFRERLSLTSQGANRDLSQLGPYDRIPVILLPDIAHQDQLN